MPVIAAEIEACCMQIYHIVMYVYQIHQYRPGSEVLVHLLNIEILTKKRPHITEEARERADRTIENLQAQVRALDRRAAA